MKLISIGLLSAIVFFASCSSENKKILVLTKSGSTVDEATKMITGSISGSADSKEMNFSGGDKITLQLKIGSNETGIDIPTKGYYVLNATNDTIVGSYVNYSAPKEAVDTFTVITQETYKKSIDSLTQLIEGKNISAANRNYFIPPHTAVKVTDNEAAIMVAPFHQMTSIAKEGDKDPEVYRFYTANEIRIKIEKQKTFTIGKPAAGTEPEKKKD